MVSGAVGGRRAARGIIQKKQKNKNAFQSKTCHKQKHLQKTQNLIPYLSDLDLYPMTLILKLYLDMVKTNRYTENEVQSYSLNRQTYRPD